MRVFSVVVATTLVAVLVAACSEDSSVGKEADPGTITVALDDLEGAEGLSISTWVVPLVITEDQTGDKEALGGAWLAVDDDPFSAQEVLHPTGERFLNFVDDQVATFEPGTYRFIIEAFKSSGPMYYGCEAQIEVIDGEPLVIALSDMPTYTGNGMVWTAADQLHYPQCSLP